MNTSISGPDINLNALWAGRWPCFKVMNQFHEDATVLLPDNGFACFARATPARHVIINVSIAYPKSQNPVQQHALKSGIKVWKRFGFYYGAGKLDLSAAVCRLCRAAIR